MYNELVDEIHDLRGRVFELEKKSIDILELEGRVVDLEGSSEFKELDARLKKFEDNQCVHCNGEYLWRCDCGLQLCSECFKKMDKKKLEKCPHK